MIEQANDQVNKFVAVHLYLCFTFYTTQSKLDEDIINVKGAVDLVQGIHKTDHSGRLNLTLAATQQVT